MRLGVWVSLLSKILIVAILSLAGFSSWMPMSGNKQCPNAPQQVIEKNCCGHLVVRQIHEGDPGYVPCHCAERESDRASVLVPTMNVASWSPLRIPLMLIPATGFQDLRGEPVSSRNEPPPTPPPPAA